MSHTIQFVGLHKKKKIVTARELIRELDKNCSCIMGMILFTMVSIWYKKQTSGLEEGSLDMTPRYIILLLFLHAVAKFVAIPSTHTV